MHKFISPGGWILPSKQQLLQFSSEESVSPRVMEDRTLKWELVAPSMYQEGKYSKDRTLGAAFCDFCLWGTVQGSLCSSCLKQANGELVSSVSLLLHKGNCCGSHLYWSKIGAPWISKKTAWRIRSLQPTESDRFSSEKERGLEDS